MTEAYKQAAALKAIEFIRPGMVVGLGTGSTAIYAVREIARKLASGDLDKILGVPTSQAVAQEAKELAIPLTTLADHPQVELTIDGADEVDPQLELIKGGGGALLREKIVAQASRTVIIVVDETKLSKQLGTHFALPVEVTQFGWAPEAAFIETLGASVVLRTGPDGDPLVTDQGNWIIDAEFGPIEDPAALALLLDKRAGIAAHGLFLGVATDLIVGGPDGVRHQARD